MRHRPEPTKHGMHCSCGVFCGRDIESWRAHRDDLLILHPGADTLERERSQMERYSEGMRQIGEAYAKIFENGMRAIKTFADALAVDLRRGNEARARQARIDAALFLNRPVVTRDFVAEADAVRKQRQGISADECGPALPLTVLCNSCGRALANVGEWCCNRFTTAADVTNIGGGA